MEETEGKFALEPEKRYENFMEAEEILSEEAPVAPVYQNAKAQLIRPKVEGLLINDIAPTYEFKWVEVGSGE